MRDVHASGRILEEALKFSKGVRHVPIIIEGEKVVVGFDGH